MNDRDIKKLQSLLQTLIDVRAELRDEIEDLRRERDQWRGYALELEATLKGIEEAGL